MEKQAGDWTTLEKIIKIREFNENDIENKVRWVNDKENNIFLHYDLPLEIEKTRVWFKNKNNANRYDAVIEYNGISVGLIGLVGINEGEGEYYVLVGDNSFKEKGVAKEASKLLIEYAKNKLKLKKILGYTEVKNERMKNLFLKLGFKEKLLIKNSIKNRGKFVDRYLFEYNI